MLPKTLPLLCVLCVLCGKTSAVAQWTKHIVVPKQPGMINSALADDWTGDGNIDVLSTYGGKAVLHTGPDWKPHTVFQVKPGLARNNLRGACIHSCLLDVDGDGDQDFIGSSNTVFWLECPNDDPLSPWSFHNVDDEILGTHCLITGDVDRDGQLDLIANSGRDKGTDFPNSLAWLAIPKNPRKAKAWTRHIFGDKDAPGASHYTGFGDVNADGRPDIACGAKGGEAFPGGEWFAWWEQPENPTAVWKKHLLSNTEPGASNIIPADFDKDGHVDYFATRGHGQGVLLFKNTGSGRFEQIEVDPDIPYPHSLALADLDADGDLDAVTCSKDPDGGTAAWYENDGKANFEKHVIGTNQGSYDTRTIDMDGDSDLDILIAGHTSNNIVWFENPHR